MTTRLEDRADLLMEQIAQLYREGGVEQTAIESLWVQFEKVEAALVKEEVRNGN